VTPIPMPSFDLPGGRLLRPLDDSDAPELYALIETNRAYLARWMPWATDQTAARTLEFIRTTGRQLAADDGFQAVLTAGGRLVGVAGLRTIDWPNRATSIGYWLDAAEQGRGTMTSAVRALVDHALGTRQLNRVEIRADIENLRSRAIPERLGFRHEGTLRQVERIGDSYRDQAIYAMLAVDWGR
jgi:ribosomal-protein-serine acetyltransferase